MSIGSSVLCIYLYTYRHVKSREHLVTLVAVNCHQGTLLLLLLLRRVLGRWVPLPEAGIRAVVFLYGMMGSRSFLFRRSTPSMSLGYRHVGGKAHLEEATLKAPPSTTHGRFHSSHISTNNINKSPPPQRRPPSQQLQSQQDPVNDVVRPYSASLPTPGHEWCQRCHIPLHRFQKPIGVPHSCSAIDPHPYRRVFRHPILVPRRPRQGPFRFWGSSYYHRLCPPAQQYYQQQVVWMMGIALVCFGLAPFDSSTD